MKFLIILLSIVCYSCTNFIRPVVYYNEVDKYIYSENGVVETDTIQIEFDDFIHKYNAAPVYINYGNPTPIIVNRFHDPILFEGQPALIKYMSKHGYTYLDTTMISVLVFVKNKL